ncbi:MULTISPECIES: molybdopterin converting factor subunit 1 [Thiorhodovibrio]|uniref:molybdopterin converting factor subunit 1 n=1 Tax=Thiorhodovibrio TaxID=61593 RepID=UPI001914BACE|nr:MULTISPECIES: molybdopterin converting factor subunit 1 [Thiorhodovibrio]MBK5968273.1 molybdopterin converting factor subunit 1 [Thiorhodovibrio winogradskyi]WPL13023.1 Sulfur carrier protein MoaD [Thiorhodovibrio litoralis]
MIRLLYFASLREALDCEGEDYALADPMTVAELRAQLAARGEPWSQALAPAQNILAAVNQTIAGPDSVIQPGDEVAFFPPVTGG